MVGNDKTTKERQHTSGIVLSFMIHGRSCQEGTWNPSLERASSRSVVLNSFQPSTSPIITINLECPFSTWTELTRISSLHPIQVRQELLCVTYLEIGSLQCSLLR